MTVSDSQFIGWFADLSLADRPQVGGKGGSLGELVRAGIAVPPGFVVKTAAFEQFLAAAESPLFATVLHHTLHNRAAAADLLGIHRATLRKKLH